MTQWQIEEGDCYSPVNSNVDVELTDITDITQHHVAYTEMCGCEPSVEHCENVAFVRMCRKMRMRTKLSGFHTFLFKVINGFKSDLILLKYVSSYHGNK